MENDKQIKPAGFFKQGNQYGKGRPKGSINRTTTQAKLAISRLANEGIDALREDLNKIRKTNPEAAAKLYIRLLEFVVPKQSQVDMRAEIDQRIQSIVVNINQNNDKEIKQ